MFLELIATFIAGFAGAGVIMALNRLSGRRLPRWLIPVGAGAAMLATTIASEYSWFPRTRDALPEGMVIAQKVESQAFYRPWTYLHPFTERFIAVDMAGLRSNEADQDLKLADLFFFGRWAPVTAAQIMVSCSEGKRADPMEGRTGDPVWRDVGPDDPIVSTVCTGKGAG
ncbi:MAG: hypothetical protein AAF415_19625 [Pseudomonadota bacterium]